MLYIVCVDKLHFFILVFQSNFRPNFANTYTSYSFVCFLFQLLYLQMIINRNLGSIQHKMKPGIEIIQQTQESSLKHSQKRNFSVQQKWENI